MIIALTGASGSTGMELKPFLLKLNHTVIEISSSAHTNGVDVFSYDDLLKTSKKMSIDLVIHLASLNSNLKKNEIDKEVNITKNVLSIMKFNNCSRVIFFSSAKVYGDNSFEHKIFSESDSLNPTCSYGIAKRECEKLIISQAENHLINYYIFRLPPLISSNSNSNLNKLIFLGIKSNLLPTFSAGDFNKRSFISITNIKRIMTIILEDINVLKKNQIFNLADNNFTSLNELLNFANSTSFVRLPNSLFNMISKIPLFRGQMLKLYGNFMLDNSKIKETINVNLSSTNESLPNIFK
jgi:nucleoside-diphosphate-sugar epimerase